MATELEFKKLISTIRNKYTDISIDIFKKILKDGSLSLRGLYYMLYIVKYILLFKNFKKVYTESEIPEKQKKMLEKYGDSAHILFSKDGNNFESYTLIKDLYESNEECNCYYFRHRYYYNSVKNYILGIADNCSESSFEPYNCCDNSEDVCPHIDFNIINSRFLDFILKYDTLLCKCVMYIKYHMNVFWKDVHKLNKDI